MRKIILGPLAFTNSEARELAGGFPSPRQFQLKQFMAHGGAERQPPPMEIREGRRIGATPLFFNAGASEVSSGECSLFLTLAGEAKFGKYNGLCNLGVLWALHFPNLASPANVKKREHSPEDTSDAPALKKRGVKLQCVFLL